MPGAYLAGKDAHVSTDAGITDLAFRSWKCSMKAAGLKINDFLSQGFQLLIVGFISASISLEGAYFAGDTALAVGEEYDFELGFSETLFLSVPALVTDITPTVDAEKEETLSVTADSTGLFAAEVS